MKPESIAATGPTPSTSGTITPKPAPAATRSTGRFHPAAWRLILVGAVFAGWIGYLGYLVYMQSRPTAAIVLSRPQLLISDVDVIAEVDGNSEPAQVRVKEVLYVRKKEGAGKQTAAPEAGKAIEVYGIKRSGHHNARTGKHEPDFTGPHTYLLPLRAVGDNRYEVVPIPYSPGYPLQPGPPRIYPDSPEIRAQYQQIPRP
jgi:hypothetical protein